MSKTFQHLNEILYSVGVLSLVAAVAVKVGVISSSVLLNTTARGCLIYSGVMFLAVLATKTVVAKKTSLD